ncbi:GroES-like protein [Epithele typhae]|uniref:GroES-like protein n=1 Tax=Epithele typhae TaxID=378194 RepID=UPI0020089842|nr:GroES-like protein [Epithele typhae]KAH9918219.1 GroES-like protein [Epithele typhae]
MTSTIPTTMKAAVIEEGHKFSIKSHPIPPVGDNDILVKTVAVALNPTDWKHIDSAAIPGSSSGVGSAVKTLSVGQQVAGFVHGSTFANEGAFAEYVKTPADLVWPIPEGVSSHEEAATIGLAFWTAAQALFHPIRLGLVEPPSNTDKKEWVFVYGGSTAIGQCTVRLADLTGYKVVATASPRNFGLVKAATGGTLAKAVDTISERDPQRICAESMGPAGGEVVLVSSPVPEATRRADVAFKPTLIYTSLGRESTFAGTMHFPVSEEDRAHMISFPKKVPGLVKSGAVKSLPIKAWDGGLDGLADGLQYMREGKVSAEKIVYRL